MQKFTLLILFLFPLIGSVYGQDDSCNCQADIQYLNAQIEQTPAYKANKVAYEKALVLALERTQSAVSTYNCFEILSRLVISLQDWHIGIYEKAADSISSSKVVYPRVSYDLDSLRQVLMDKEATSVEGIYYAKLGTVMGLVYTQYSVYGSAHGQGA